MRKGKVYRNNKLVGILSQKTMTDYEFRYEDTWFYNRDLPAISLTLPKTKQTFSSDHLFPFFFNLLSEGVNRELQAKQLKIDEIDYFGLLLATAGTDTFGAITIEKIEL